MIDWEEIDKIERQVPVTKPYERKKVPPSVDKIISDFDNDPIFTEERFYQGTQETVFNQECDYLQKALRKTLRWQSFCKPTT